MNSDQSKAQSSADDIEGVEDPSGSGWGDYPLDSVFVRQETRTVSDVLQRIEKGRFVLDPDFQRDFIWPVDKQSKLIESCVMRIPLPVFYVAEAEDGRIVVVDGLQRITTFERYVRKQFRLSGISEPQENPSPHPIEGKNFEELPLNLQERILDTQLILYILDAKAPERARLDIFERVNSGVPLTRQQMRNAIYNGPATRWLRDAASSTLFRRTTGHSLNPKTMRDREAINRFCAFILLGVSEYRGDMDSFLASALKRMNMSPTTELDSLSEHFQRALKSNQNLFKQHAFRKSLGHDDRYAKKSVINISLFEVCMVLFAQAQEELTIDTSDGERVRDAFIELLNDDDFSLSITYSTNSTNSVKRRFSLAEKTLRQAI